MIWAEVPIEAIKGPTAPYLGRSSAEDSMDAVARDKLWLSVAR